MSELENRIRNRVSWQDRITARRIGFSSEVPELDLPLELQKSGSEQRGQALLQGWIRLGDGIAKAEGDPPRLFSVVAPTAGFELSRQSFDWLADCAALGTHAARSLANEWVSEWHRRFARGGGPGWTPIATARRVAALMDHLGWLSSTATSQQRSDGSAVLYRSSRFLAQRYANTASGPDAIEATTVLIRVCLSLPDFESHVTAALTHLEGLCEREIGQNGEIPSRNPQQLLEVFSHLAQTRATLQMADQRPRPQLRKALDRIAPTLRLLRHADGHLARFHDGGRGDLAQIDTALASAGETRLPTGARTRMGYARLRRGRTSVLVDAAGPPLGLPIGASSHASTLAFELTSGRRPIIVSEGPGSHFGPEIAQGSRATSAHSTLEIDGQSTARTGRSTRLKHVFTEGPTDVQADLAPDGPMASLVAAHNGYANTLGLIHVRRLDLGEAGRELSGEDVLTAITEAEKRRLDVVLRSRPATGAGDDATLPFVIRFHLHPDVSVDAFLADGTVTLTLKSGEVWIFRHSSSCAMRLDPGRYLEKTRTEPTETQQIVLSGRVGRTMRSVRWSLIKATETPDFVRDFNVASEPAQQDS